MSPREPVSVSVARIRLEGGQAHVDDEAPDTIRLKSGQPLRVLVHYRIEESSHEQEEFHVALRSHLGDQRPKEARRNKHDRPMLNDAEWGHLHQDFRPLTAGKHELFVDISASYGHRKWDGKGGEQVQAAELARSIDVVVE